MMLNATRAVAFVLILALGSGLALVAGPLSPGPEVSGGPVLEAPGPEAAARFHGAGTVSLVESGEATLVDGVPRLNGQVSQLRAETIEVDDPRMAGTQTFTQHAVDYSGDTYPDFGPTWGEMRIEDDDGAWAGHVAGVFTGGGSELSGWLVGEGAYDGLVEYVHFQTSGYGVEFSGLIYPADAAPLVLQPE